MTVCEIEHGMTPQPNCIYTTPPNRNLDFRDDRFVLVEPALEVLPKPRSMASCSRSPKPAAKT